MKDNNPLVILPLSGGYISKFVINNVVRHGWLGVSTSQGKAVCYSQQRSASFYALHSKDLLYIAPGVSKII